MRTIIGCGKRFHCVHPDPWAHIDTFPSPSLSLSDPLEANCDGQSAHQPEVFPVATSVLSSCSSDDESLGIDSTTRHYLWVKMIQNSDWERLYVSLIAVKKQRKSLPVAVVMPDDQKMSVVHHAVSKAPNALILILLDVITSLMVFEMSGSPESKTKQYLLYQDKNGNTALHIACANLQVSSNASGELRIDFSVIKNLLMLEHKALGVQNNAGDTPFHLILASDAFGESSVSIEKVVVEATLSILAMAKHLSLCPLLVRNKYGYTPLHICAKLNSPTLLTQTILESNASVAAIVTTQGAKTPLRLAMSTLIKVGNNHDAAELRNALANVAALATPEACMVLDAKKQTALMYAVQNKKWSTLLANILISAHPESASVVTPEGYLALHFACQNEKIKCSTIKDLLMAYPAGVACLTRKRNTPLHFATKSGAVPVVKLLIQLYPKALQLRNAKGEWPIDRAIANNVDVKVIALCDY